MQYLLNRTSPAYFVRRKAQQFGIGIWKDLRTLVVSTGSIDGGLNDLFATDTGSKQGNLRHPPKYAAHLVRRQSRVSNSKKLGLGAQVVRLHTKIVDCRIKS